MLEVLLEGVALGHAVQDRVEVRARVTHEGDEEQAGLQLPQGVGAVGVVVAAAQHPAPLVLLRRDDGDMRVGRHERLALVVLGLVVHGRELLGGLRGVGDAQRRPVALVAPHGLLLLDEPQPVPDLGEHADAPGHVVGAARHPLGCGVVALLNPQVLVELVGGVLGLDVVGAVLEAEEVARRLLVHGGRRRAPVADLAPPQCGGPEGDAGEVADRVDAHLGVVGAGLDE